MPEQVLAPERSPTLQDGHQVDAIDLDAFTTLDAYLGVRTERWHVELFARNLFDEEALLTRTNSTAVVRRQPTGYANHWPIPSRRVGLSASYRW